MMQAGRVLRVVRRRFPWRTRMAWTPRGLLAPTRSIPSTSVSHAHVVCGVVVNIVVLILMLMLLLLLLLFLMLLLFMLLLFSMLLLLMLLLLLLLFSMLLLLMLLLLHDLNAVCHSRHVPWNHTFHLRVIRVTCRGASLSHVCVASYRVTLYPR